MTIASKTIRAALVVHLLLVIGCLIAGNLAAALGVLTAGVTLGLVRAIWVINFNSDASMKNFWHFRDKLADLARLTYRDLRALRALSREASLLIAEKLVETRDELAAIERRIDTLEKDQSAQRETNDNLAHGGLHVVGALQALNERITQLQNRIAPSALLSDPPMTYEAPSFGPGVLFDSGGFPTLNGHRITFAEALDSFGRISDQPNPTPIQDAALASRPLIKAQDIPIGQTVEIDAGSRGKMRVTRTQEAVSSNLEPLTGGGPLTQKEIDSALEAERNRASMGVSYAERAAEDAAHARGIAELQQAAPNTHLYEVEGAELVPQSAPGLPRLKEFDALTGDQIAQQIAKS